MRRPPQACLGHAASNTAVAGQPDGDLAEQRGDRVLTIILDPAGRATAAALRTVHGLDPGLRGDNLPLDAGQELLALGQAQTQAAQIGKGVGLGDPHDIGAVFFALSSDADQPHDPGHVASTSAGIQARKYLFRSRTPNLAAVPSMAVDITALYCCLDDFCKVFADWEAHRLLPSEQARQRSGKLSRAEMLFIVVLFHLSPYKNFKVFYLYGIGGQYRACFDELPHYDRFVSLMPRLFVPLMVLLHGLSGEQTGVYFVDLTKLAVCHNRRIHRHKVFDGLAARGKTSMGWFYGLKLHFVINHKGQIMALKITPGNTADSTVLEEMTRHLAGKLYADKGYIGRELFHKLWRRGLHLITSIRRNMRNYLMPLADKVMLRKRFVIETVLDTLKSEMGLEHSRHRSVVNAMVHVLSCLIAYAFRPGKPSISLTK